MRCPIRLPVVALVFLLTACATTGPRMSGDLFMRHKALVQASVSLALAVTLRAHPEWAAPLVQAVAVVRPVVADRPDIAVETALTLLGDAMPLAPVDRALVLPVLVALGTEVTLLLEEHGLRTPETVRPVLLALLGWIDQTARPFVAVAGSEQSNGPQQ